MDLGKEVDKLVDLEELELVRELVLVRGNVEFDGGT